MGKALKKTSFNRQVVRGSTCGTRISSLHHDLEEVEPVVEVEPLRGSASWCCLLSAGVASLHLRLHTFDLSEVSEITKIAPMCLCQRTYVKMPTHIRDFPIAPMCI